MGFLIDPYRTPPVSLTSTPYPIIWTDSVASLAMTLENYNVYGWLPLEATVEMSIVSGELRLIFKTYDNPWEGSAVDMSIQAGELRDIFKTYDVPWEGATVSVELQAGELKVVLIEYRLWDADYEQTTSSMSIISGSLT